MFFLAFTIICALSVPATIAAYFLADWIHIAEPSMEIFIPMIVMIISWMLSLLRFGKAYSIIGSIAVFVSMLTLSHDTRIFPSVIFAALWLLASFDMNKASLDSNTAEQDAAANP